MVRFSRWLVDPFEAPQLVDHEGFKVVREDMMGFGSKCRFGDILVSTCRQDTLVYVQPRYGFAGISLAYLAKKYNKKLVLFSPSQKEISDHQAICVEMGAEMKFKTNNNIIEKIYFIVLEFISKNRKKI